MSAENTTREFEYDGETYTVDLEAYDDVEALEAREDQRYATLGRLLLGSAQWKKFKSKKRPVGDLLDMLVLALGIDDEEE